MSKQISPEFRSAQIAALNDTERKRLGSKEGCLTVLTSGIANLPIDERFEIADKVRDFEDFTRDNDPYGEHDMGSFEHNGKKIFWKFDYYDSAGPDMEYGSEDPADPEKTTRLLTIMLADEY